MGEHLHAVESGVVYKWHIARDDGEVVHGPFDTRVEAVACLNDLYDASEYVVRAAAVVSGPKNEEET
jgi:hypothetical protein